MDYWSGMREEPSVATKPLEKKKKKKKGVKTEGQNRDFYLDFIKGYKVPKGKIRNGQDNEHRPMAGTDMGYSRPNAKPSPIPMSILY
jgi:hypothetical protein